MQNSSAKTDELAPNAFGSGRTARVMRVLLALAWDLVRLPVLTLLAIVEPLVQFALSACALLLALTAIFFKLILHRPDFPFWGMLALSVACVWALAIYYALMRLLALRAAPGHFGP